MTKVSMPDIPQQIYMGLVDAIAKLWFCDNDEIRRISNAIRDASLPSEPDMVKLCAGIADSLDTFISNKGS